ncbi:hypothetical protein SADUNF_Sadunf18G0086900 [Salix dunnii]|uniref:Uncharacterized protein n=1 Tax=Salix dunnii TaxID=1413687 RepID=A0A835MDT5_9ROSI|nr:hypothetical protein SADUNF_Sadunf18G0086900 [Salix dunnii]
MNEATWKWRLMKNIMTVCHVYEEEENYAAFDKLAPDESQPVTFLKILKKKRSLVLETIMHNIMDTETALRLAAEELQLLTWKKL